MDKRALGIAIIVWVILASLFSSSKPGETKPHFGGAMLFATILSIAVYLITE